MSTKILIATILIKTVVKNFKIFAEVKNVTKNLYYFGKRKT